MSEPLLIRDVPNELWEIVLWAKKPVWYQGHVVYPDEGEITGVGVCTQEEWKQRGGWPLMPGWKDGKFDWPTAE